MPINRNEIYNMLANELPDEAREGLTKILRTTDNITHNTLTAALELNDPRLLAYLLCVDPNLNEDQKERLMRESLGRALDPKLKLPDVQRDMYQACANSLRRPRNSEQASE